MQPAEVPAMLIQCPGFIPPSSDTWVILPLVEKVEMIRVRVVDRDHGKMLLQMRDPSTVDDRARFRFWFPGWMHSVPWYGRKLGSRCILEWKWRVAPGDWLA